jgi:hypothetical protein
MQYDTRRHLIALALLLCGAVPANLLWSRRAPEVSYHVDFKALPRQVAGLTGSVVPVDQQIFQYLGADAMQDMIYQNDKQRIKLSLVYGTDWRAVHSPLSCLPQQGWLVDERKLLDLPAPAGCPHPGPLHGQLLRAHRETGQEQLVLYVFAHKDGTTGDWKKQEWEVSREPRGTGGLMLLLSAPVIGNDVQGAQSLMKEVLDGVYVPAVSFWHR